MSCWHIVGLAYPTESDYRCHEPRGLKCVDSGASQGLDSERSEAGYSPKEALILTVSLL